MNKMDALEKALFYAEAVIEKNIRINNLLHDIDRIQELQSRSATKSWDQVTTAQKNAIREWVSHNQYQFLGQKIAFIKELREVFPYIDLKTAKDQVENYSPDTDQALKDLRDKLMGNTDNV